MTSFRLRKRRTNDELGASILSIAAEDEHGAVSQRSGKHAHASKFRFGNGHDVWEMAACVRREGIDEPRGALMSAKLRELSGGGNPRPSGLVELFVREVG